MRSRIYSQIKKKLSLLRYPSFPQTRAPFFFKNNLKQRGSIGNDSIKKNLIK